MAQRREAEEEIDLEAALGRKVRVKWTTVGGKRSRTGILKRGPVEFHGVFDRPVQYYHLHKIGGKGYIPILAETVFYLRVHRKNWRERPRKT